MSYKVRFFNPAKGYFKIKKEIDAEIQRILSAGDLILRDDVERFEENLAKFVGTKYAIALNSGTDALYLSLWAFGIGKGDEVITSSHTFVATIQVIHQLGATPVLADLGDNWVSFRTRKTKAVIPCHIAGEISPWKAPDSLVCIEDSCQSLGAIKNPITNAQCWSFYPAKVLGAYGDAGAITTNDKALADEIKELRNHYKKDYSKWGINSRMDNLQATILNVKFKYLPQVLQRRQEIAQIYHTGLHAVPIHLPALQEGRVWQDYIIRTDKRDALFDFLKENGIETMKNEYPFPIPKLPKSIQYEAETLRLPINEVLLDSEVDYIIRKIRGFYV